jgi:hypothetical protein
MTGDARALDLIQRRALVVGAAGLLVCVLGAIGSPRQFFQSYLVGYLFWAGIALGCTAIVMLHHLVGGGWGVAIRRLLESGTRTFPFLALLLIPLLFGLRHLYIWARPDVVAADELLQHKQPYLNVPFFLLRTAFYFAVWLVLAYFLNRWSGEQDRAQSPAVQGRLQKLSGPGLVIYGLTVTFASVDWVMSLEPHWYSTIYGIIFMVGQALATLAFVITALMVLSSRTVLGDMLTAQNFHDLGNLMLAFVMLWAYVAFSQFLIVWSGNLPEEIPWYIARMGGGWGWIAGGLIVFHFALPFLLLLSRQNKRRLRTLATLAAAMLVLRLVDLFWIVAPAFHEKQFHVHWMDLAAPVGIGGIWIAAFVWQLKRRPLLPAGAVALSKAP